MYLYINNGLTSFVTGHLYPAVSTRISLGFIPFILLTFFFSACASLPVQHVKTVSTDRFPAYLPVQHVKTVSTDRFPAYLPVQHVKTVSIDRFPAYHASVGTEISPESVDEAIPDVDILALDSETTILLDNKVAKIPDPKKRLKALKNILFKKVKGDSVNDLYDVKTAQEAFDTGTANCLSFSNLFVATARYVGLNVQYIEISSSPVWRKDRDFLYITRHIGVAVTVSESLRKVIQLEITQLGEACMVSDGSAKYSASSSKLMPVDIINTAHFTPVSDNRAFAQYYNNSGSKYMAEGNRAAAYQYFVKALKIDPEFSFAWANLGVIYRLSGQNKVAEDAYFQGFAVTCDKPDNGRLAILNNLMCLYERTGKNDKADLYRSYLSKLKKENPYCHYSESRTAYERVRRP
ncbi:MAG: transglutaminase domain-containing protein [Desulfobacteraceae bacterium]|jgi:tetratricopeptide (TPR) repeat protein